jgi:hypothetical protein
MKDAAAAVVSAAALVGAGGSAPSDDATLDAAAAALALLTSPSSIGASADPSTTAAAVLPSALAASRALAALALGTPAPSTPSGGPGTGGSSTGGWLDSAAAGATTTATLQTSIVSSILTTLSSAIALDAAAQRNGSAVVALSPEAAAVRGGPPDLFAPGSSGASLAVRTAVQATLSTLAAALGRAASAGDAPLSVAAAAAPGLLATPGSPRALVCGAGAQLPAGGGFVLTTLRLPTAAPGGALMSSSSSAWNITLSLNQTFAPCLPPSGATATPLETLLGLAAAQPPPSVTLSPAGLRARLGLASTAPLYATLVQWGASPVSEGAGFASRTYELPASALAAAAAASTASRRALAGTATTTAAVTSSVVSSDR